MIRQFNILAIIICIVLIGGLYHIRYTADARAHELAKIRAEMKRETLHGKTMLVEWESLNDPGRLHSLAENRLGLKPASVAQLTSAETLSSYDVVRVLYDPNSQGLEIYNSLEAVR
jgi:hypothetical protein